MKVKRQQPFVPDGFCSERNVTTWLEADLKKIYETNAATAGAQSRKIIKANFASYPDSSF